MAQDRIERELHLQELYEAIHSEKCMLMAGYGLSAQAYTSEKRYPRSWREVLKQLADYCREEGLIIHTELQDFHKLLDYQVWNDAGALIEKKLPDSLQRKAILKDILLANRKVTSEAHRLVARLPFWAYITTTPDLLIEEAYGQKKGKLQLHKSYKADEQIIQLKRSRTARFILKLHGDIELQAPLCLSDMAFEQRLLPTDEPSKDTWQRLLLGAHMLFIGFEQENPGLECIKHFCEQELFDFDQSIKHWIAVPQKQENFFKEELAKYANIHVISYSPEEGLVGFLRQLLPRPVKRRVPKPNVPRKIVNEPFQVFLIQAKDDDPWRKTLQDYLNSLVKERLITIWYPGMIIPGTQQLQEITRYLDTADIVLLLVSQHFLSSKDCEKQTEQAIQRYGQGTAKVVPIILSPCSWENTSFGGLAPLPPDGEAIYSRSSQDQPKAFMDIVQGIRKIVENLREASGF